MTLGTGKGKLLVAPTVALAVSLLAPWGGSASAAHTTQPAVAAPSVSISGDAFVPQTLNVKVGDTVTWTNKDSDSHNVVSDGSGPLNSPTLNQGSGYSYHFTKAGSYSYHCAFHDFMHGTVVVS